MNKKITALVLAVLMCFGAVSFADTDTDATESDIKIESTEQPETTAEPESTEQPETTAEPGSTEQPEITVKPEPTLAPETLADTVDIKIEMIKHPIVQDSFAKLELYSQSGELLGTQREWVGGITDSIDLSFSVPQYTLGETFKLKLVEGLQYVEYYNDKYYPGNEFLIQTYGYTDDAGNYIKGNSFVLTGDPKYKIAIVMYNQNGMMSLAPKARFIDGVTYVPVRQAAESLGLNVRYDSRYNSVAVSIGKKEIAYNIGSSTTNFFGTDKQMQGITRSIEGYVFVPVRSLAESFGADVDVKDFGDHYDVILGKATAVTDYFNSMPPNAKGIGSQTNYLVWVSKHEYKVRVYKGQQYRWEQIAEYPCAIGAPGTPTVTGQFSYFSRESVWDYGTYYVGPIMRFYNGYALHSTLRYYGGGEYDGRVGVQISHGCVRLKPAAIEWMVNTIPLYSRVWVTE